MPNLSVGSPPTSLRGRFAFTLIELLVVIAIISLLASILFPVFSRARENARRASCQTGMRFIGLGIRQYVRDYDEKLPVAKVNDTPSATQVYGWADAVLPYSGSINQFQCPSEGNPPPTVDTNSNGTLWDEDHICDYAYNSNVSGLPEADITSSASTIMLSENIVVSASPPVNRGDGRNSFGDNTGATTMTINADNTRHPPAPTTLSRTAT